MLKQKNNTDCLPHRIKDLLNRTNACKSFIPSNRAYKEEDWYIFISSCVDFVFNRGQASEKTDAITAYIYNFFKERKLFPEWFDENISYFDEDDLDYFYEHIKQLVDALFISNNYKYHGLFESTILEFNPLWNVDGTETTTRTLNQDGTITTEDVGSDTTTHKGTDTTLHTGTDTALKTGTDTLAQTGTDATAHSGTQTDAHTGTDANAHTGTETVAREASNTDGLEEGTETTRAVTAFNDDNFMDAEKTNDHHEADETHTIDEDTTTTFNDTTTETKNLTDQTTFNDTVTETKNLNDQRTYNLSDSKTVNLSDQESLNLTDQSDKENTTTTTRDLIDTETTILERHGNIGVTTTTKLLTEFREYVFYNFMDVVAHDIVNLFTYAIY